MMSACYCTKSCQYHIKYPIHVYSDVIQRASYLDLELYSHSWRIFALQTWLHHFFCCFDVFRMITTKTWLNAPGESVKGSLYGAYFSAFAQLFTKHGRSSSTLPQHHPLPSFLNCSKTGPPISLKFGRSIRTGSPNIPSNFQAEIRSCPRETSRKSQYR